MSQHVKHNQVKSCIEFSEDNVRDFLSSEERAIEVEYQGE